MAEFRMGFMKTGNLKYLSHLELIRALERAARRSRLPMEHSEGYHPHPKLSFGPALALGIASTSEYFDVGLGREMEPASIQNSLNQVLPESLRITAAGRLNEPVIPLNALINRAAYRIELTMVPQSLPGVKADLAAIISKQELVVSRNTKTGQKMVNIRPLLHNLTMVETSEDPGDRAHVLFVFDISGEIGNNGNLRPDEITGLIKQPLTVSGITRIGLWREERGMIIKPMDLCVQRPKIQ